MTRVLFVITEDWALISHRLHLVRYAIDAGFEVAVATKLGLYRTQLENLGIAVFDWPIRRGALNPINQFAAVARLGKIIRQFKPQIIHAVALKPVIYTGIATRFRCDIAVVSALGGVGYIFSSTNLKARILRIPTITLLRFALSGRRRRLIMQNIDDLKMFLRADVISPEYIYLVKGAGVEVDQFKLSALPSDVIRVILPARMLWDKGVKEFVNVARRIRKNRQDVQFVLVGNSDAQNPASIPEKQIENWINEGCVEHLHHVTHEQMPEVYESSTIVCLPSYREGLPKVLLEAASMGRPLVAFDVAGCREVVRSGVNGELVPFGREDLLENAILSFIEDRQKSEQFGLNGRKMVCDEFASGVINKQTTDIWQKLIGV